MLKLLIELGKTYSCKGNYETPRKANGKRDMERNKAGLLFMLDFNNSVLCAGLQFRVVRNVRALFFIFKYLFYPQV